MRRNMSCIIGLLFVMLFAGLASAALAKAVPAKGTANAELIQTLKSAHRLLVSADYDYEGHRAKAAKDVRNTLEELGHHHKKAQPGLTPNKGGVVPPKVAHASQEKMHEPQATSDAQLREAQQLLQGALTQLNVRHPQATANVKAAITEINMALAIK